jgi:eukaryotic-like serine/threonine-protein kinase
MSDFENDEWESFEENKLYRKVRKIAQGGMGAVYEAKQFGAEGFNKTVAVKTILGNYCNNAEFVRLFIGEAMLVADLVHENIVQVYHLGKIDEIYYISMEYVEGFNLEKFIDTHVVDKNIPLPIELGAFIISRVCRGLEYAHNKQGQDGQPLGIVHRDVSPKNIMLNYEGVVKLTDFGIAQARMYMQQNPEVMMGKVEYMSPEQASYEPTDRRSDLFSLGIVMYELLVGKHIFSTDDPFQTLDNVKTKPIPDPKLLRPDLPDDLCKIMLRALDRDVTKRFQTAGEMGTALEYFLYHDRYGPTNVTLGKYLRKVFRGEDVIECVWTATKSQ